MPNARSQSGRKVDVLLNTTSKSRTTIETSGSGENTKSVDPEQETTLKTSRVSSRRCTGSLKRLLAVLEAEERVAELRLEEVRLAAKVAAIKLKKIQAMKSDEEEEKEEGQASTLVEEASKWLKKQEEEIRPAPPPPLAGREAAVQDGRGQRERRFCRPEAIVIGEMEKIRRLRKIGDNARDLLVFSDKVANIVATIEAQKKIYLYNPEMARTVLEKLSPIIRYKWYDYAARTNEDEPEIKRLSTFLNEEADKCSAFASFESIRERKKPGKAYRTHKPRCPACGDLHSLPSCNKFQAATVDQRWDIAKENRVCFRCLRGDHRRGNCRARLCGHQGCSMAHHMTLHQESTRQKERIASVHDECNK